MSLNQLTIQKQELHQKDEAENKLDFIATSESIKTIFSIPYQKQKVTSIAIHNIGNGTLVLDDATDITNGNDDDEENKTFLVTDETKLLLKDKDDEVINVLKNHNTVIHLLKEQHQNDIPKQHESKQLITSKYPLMIEDKKQEKLQPPEYYATNAGISTPSHPRQYLPWKFHEMSLLVASDALLYRNDADSNALVVRVADSNIMKNHTKTYQSHYTLPSYADVVSKKHMEVQTCIIPPTTPTTSFINDFYRNCNIASSNNELSSTICTCLDAYLDTIMTNVPQLALCLEEKGYIQSVKLLQSQDIPTHYYSDTTTDEKKPFIFQPNVVDLNATILLRFLKENCTTENSTYLLHHTPESQQVQLYDVTSISQHRQKKWIWWLTTISYRFALRLIRLSKENTIQSESNQHLRDRIRNLLRTTLDLLIELSDMEDESKPVKYETIRATVYELLADTFLQNTSWLSYSQPYENLSIDGLTKAQDYLLLGVKTLKPLLKNTNKDIITSIKLQLFGLHYKIVNVSLRLASHHLRNYWSSSVMQSLRISATTLYDSVSYGEERVGLLYQYAWIWEYCGHFARSFAANDDLWRERGHACGDDVISLLREVEDIFFKHQSFMKEYGISSVLEMTRKSKGKLTLWALQPLIHEGAEEILNSQKSRVKDKWRVLVSSALCYSRAIETFDIVWNIEQKTDANILSILRKRLGDACNEIGKILLSLCKELLQSNDTSKSSSILFLSSAQFWFEEGLHNFELCNDVRNIALLRCNLCQCCKIRANSFLVDSNTDAEKFLQDAANHLQLAHIALDTRDKVDTKTWDMVSEELAATFLILGVRRRQMVLGGGASTPNIMDVLLQTNELSPNRLTPGNERSIIEPMSRALSIYTTLGNTHQVAAAHYQLALFYSKIWTCQRDEKITRIKLSLALKHFQSAHAYFIRNCIGNDGALTFVILCLDLSNLYSAVIFSSTHPLSQSESPNAASLDCTIQALNCCIDTAQAFSPDSIQCTIRTNTDITEWLSKMNTLAKNVEDRIFKLLLHLVKIEKEKLVVGGTYKTLYRIALDAKREQVVDKKDGEDLSFAVYGLLTKIKEYNNRNKMQ